MSAIVKLKAGIQTMDWGLVLDAYTDMTGDSSVTLPRGDIEPTELRSIRFAIHKAVDEALRPFAESEPVFDDDEPVDLERREEDNRTSPPPAAPANVQGFSTDPTPTEVEETRALEALRRGKRTVRPPIQPKQVVCTGCGNTFESPVSLGKEMGTLCPACLRVRKPRK